MKSSSERQKANRSRWLYLTRNITQSPKMILKLRTPLAIQFQWLLEKKNNFTSIRDSEAKSECKMFFNSVLRTRSEITRPWRSVHRRIWRLRKSAKGKRVRRSACLSRRLMTRRWTVCSTFNWIDLKTTLIEGSVPKLMINFDIMPLGFME